MGFTKKLKSSKKRITDIPSDCVAIITCFLDEGDDFFSIQRSCKFFNDIFMEKDFFGCENISFTFREIKNNIELQKFQPYTLTEIPFVKRIIFPPPRKNYSDQIIVSTFKLFSLYSQKFIHVEELQFGSLGNDQSISNELFNVLKDTGMAKKIKYIGFGNWGKESSRSFEPFTVFSQLKSLKFCSLTFKIDSFKAKNFPFLEQMKIDLRETITDKFIKEISSVPKLTKLSLKVGRINSNSIEKPKRLSLNFSLLKKITKLSIKRYCEMALSKNMFQGMKNLKELRIRFEKSICSRFQETFFGLPNLELLEFNGYHHLDLSILVPIIQNNSIKKMRIISMIFPVISNLHSFTAFTKLKTKTKISICCNKFYSPKNFVLSKLYFKDEDNSKEYFWLTPRCQICKRCNCGSNEKSLILCSFLRKTKCGNIFCRECKGKNHCKRCKYICCKDCEVEEEYQCAYCDYKSSCSNVKCIVSECHYCKERVCRNCRTECKSCCRRICKKCRFNLVYCEECRDFVGCTVCSICSFCRKSSCRKHGGALVICDCRDSSPNLHRACINHSIEIGNERRTCFACLPRCTICHKTLQNPEKDTFFRVCDQCKNKSI